MNKKICLDAGHFGKFNQSPAAPAYYESEMNWKLHLMLKDALEKFGFEVILTRENQTSDLSLENRGKKSKGCCLFLSVHSNASTNVSDNYAMACCMVDDKTTGIDEISVQLGSKLANAVTYIMTGKENGGRTYRRYGSNGEDYYGVIRGAKSVGTPAILLEHGFHTNLGNVNFLMNDNNLKKLAIEEAEIIAEFFGMKKPDEKLIGDMDGDGKLTSYDALKILQKIVEN